jgi:nucleoid-associated protein YgaU
MFLKNSRYAKNPVFEPNTLGQEVFAGVRSRSIGAASGVVEHQVKLGDRLDLLARHYYNDDRLWWRIVDANPEFIFAGDMLLDDMKGATILIPRIRE